MIQKFTILFDLDGSIVNWAPDLMCAHNYVLKKYGYKTGLELGDKLKFLKERWIKNNFTINENEIKKYLGKKN